MKRIMGRRALLIAIRTVTILAAIWSFVLLASPPAETLDQRVIDVASQLKCPVCQGESVADSPALISQQMRAVIRQQLSQGRSEQQVISYFVDRYGSGILWSPPRQGFTLIAWIVPPAFLLLGAITMLLVLRGWQKTAKSSPHDGEAGARANANEGSDSELAQFESELQRELAAEDALFARKEGLS
jgi:cytochrome c-type biogenesis protein CcmH